MNLYSDESEIKEVIKLALYSALFNHKVDSSKPIKVMLDNHHLFTKDEVQSIIDFIQAEIRTNRVSRVHVFHYDILCTELSKYVHSS